LHDKLRTDGRVKNVNKEHSEDLEVQLKMAVLRWYYRSSQSPRSVHGNDLMRLVSVKTVFITFCRVRRQIGQIGV
jgi:hypothetical protein